MYKLSKKALEKLKEQRDKLNARIQQKEKRIKTSERKKETRRKILIGSYHYDHAIKENKMDEIKSIMDKYQKRNSDRELFNLELIPEIK